MSYIIYKSDGTIFLTLEDGQIDNVNTSLTLVGKRVVNYGQYENTNLVKLLENFANSSSPTSPVAGQLWFDKTNGTQRLKIYNGTTWNSLPNFVISTSTPTINFGDFWLESASSTLYFRNTTTLVTIGGPNAVVGSATRLANNITINGTPFTGTASITISSTTTNKLTFGGYLTGGEFNGSSATTINVDIGTVNEPTPSKIVARDNNGDIWFRIGYGTATASRYADLAEKYLTDDNYPVGTVVKIGGAQEVTQCQIGDRAIGVISDKPGFMMNQDLENGTFVALKGRVPVRIQGSIRKGQRLIAGPNGTAVASLTNHPDVFAVAIENSDDNKQLVEALIL